MSWYRETDNSTPPAYTAPKVSELKLDAGGNYVSAAPNTMVLPDGTTVIKPLGNSVIE